MPFVHNINPTLIDFGPVEIRYYGLVYLLGFLLVYLYFRYMINHKKLELDMEELYDLIFYLMMGVLIGSRVVHAVFWNPMYYLTQPWKIFFIWEGGMAFHGGLLGVIIATYLFSRKKYIRKKVSFLRLGDILSIPATLALAIGRIANFINGELPGRVTDVPWCWYFPGVDGCRHPQQLYSSAKRFLIFGILLFLNRKRHKEGFIMWSMIFLTGIGRFIIDFYREDAMLLGLTAGQYLSLLMIIAGAYALFTRYRKDIRNVFGV
ncbi:MAG: prolipoprotein diacylglyceryl transferase [Candidatus Woesearchaeota archaeon]